MVNQVWPQEETEKLRKKKKTLYYTYGKDMSGQEAEDRRGWFRLLLLSGFLQERQNRTG